MSVGLVGMLLEFMGCRQMCKCVSMPSQSLGQVLHQIRHRADMMDVAYRQMTILCILHKDIRRKGCAPPGTGLVVRFPAFESFDSCTRAQPKVSDSRTTQQVPEVEWRWFIQPSCAIKPSCASIRDITTRAGQALF